MSLSIAADPIPLWTDADGVVHVKSMRLTLDTLVATFDRGDTPHEIVSSFAGIDLPDVYAILAHVLRHRRDVDAYLAEQDAKAMEIRRLVEARQGSQAGLRERLLARRDQRASS